MNYKHLRRIVYRFSQVSFMCSFLPCCLLFFLILTPLLSKTVTELKVTGIDNFANLFNIWGRIKVNVTPADLKDISINIEKDVAGTAFTVTFKKAGGQFLPTASIPALAAGGKPSKKRLNKLIKEKS